MNLQFRAQFKLDFFDSEKVVNAMDRKTHRAMKGTAAMTRTVAKRSMRMRKLGGKPSRPGQPPKAVREHPFLRKLMFFHYDAAGKKAVIGPAKFPGGDDAPPTLEYGGRIDVPNPRRRTRKFGSGGEIAVVGRADRRGRIGKHGPNTKPTKDYRGRKHMVSYARLKTQEQVERANYLNAYLYGPARIKARVKQRPFMAPALSKAATTMASRWK